MGDKPRPGAQLPPLAQAPTLTGSMVSARPPAHRTPPPQPPQPPQQPQQPQQLPQQPQPLRRLLPQLQRRPRPAALQAHSPPSTATPASATPSDSTSAAPSPAPAPRRQPQQRQQQRQQQPQQLLQPVRWTPDLQPASLVSFPSHTAAPPSQAVPSGFTGGRTRASSGTAPRLSRPAPT